MSNLKSAYLTPIVETVTSIGLSCLGISIGALGLGVPAAIAQITPDPTLGPESSTVTNQRNQGRTVIQGGAERGPNLFHSFDAFNVPENRSVFFFTDNAQVENILTRVTGNTASELLGTLGTFGGNEPNLFLINPNGITVGENAQLNVGGSFFATTAEGIQFGTQGVFSAQNPAIPSNLLTIDPSAFLFEQLSPDPRPFINLSSRWQVPNGQTLLLLGGDVLLDGAQLRAAGGRVEIGAIADPAVIPFTVSEGISIPDGVKQGPVTIGNDSTIDVAFTNGGSINMHAATISLTNSGLNAGLMGPGEPNNRAGNIQLAATEQIQITNSQVVNDVSRNSNGTSGDITLNAHHIDITDLSILNTNLFGTGTAGNIQITASEATIQNSRLASAVGPNATGTGGTIALTTNQLEIVDGAQLLASTRGQGNAGLVDLRADGPITIQASAISSEVDVGANGNAGGIQITAQNLTVVDGGQLLANTTGEGDAGNILITISNGVAFDGTSADGQAPSGATIAVSGRGQGAGGLLRIEASTLDVRNGAQFNARTRGDSTTTLSTGELITNPGRVEIEVSDRVTFAGVSADENFSSGIISSLEGRGQGTGGPITIITPILEVLDGAGLISSTSGDGDAGKLEIRASDRVTLADRRTGGRFLSRMSSSVNPQGNGNGGVIDIQTERLEVFNGGRLVAGTLGNGNAGNVTIAPLMPPPDTPDDAQFEVIFSGVSGDGQFPSGIFSTVEAGAVGRGGDITIETESLSVLDGAQLRSNTAGMGRAGNITLQGEQITFTDRRPTSSGLSGAASAVERTGQGRGGKIEIQANVLEVLGGSQLVAGTRGDGRAGNIQIMASDRVTFQGTSQDGETISAALSDVDATGMGHGGNIIVETPTLDLLDGARLVSTTRGEGDAGNIRINAPNRVTLIDTRDQGRFLSGVSSAVVGRGVGNGGQITLETGILEMRDGSQLLAGTGANGNAGRIKIEAGDRVILEGISRDGQDATAIISSVDARGVGNGGLIQVATNQLDVLNGAQLVVSTTGQGDAGQIFLDVGDRAVFSGTHEGSNGEAQFISGASSLVNRRGEGAGGPIVINTGILDILDGARIRASTAGTGDAGPITIQADERVTLRGNGPDNSFSRMSSSVGRSGNGQGGPIQIQTDELAVLDGARLSVSTRGNGRGGTINAQVSDRITLDNGTIEARSGRDQRAGDIDLSADWFVLDNQSNILTQTLSANGGNVTLNVGSFLLLRDNSLISTEAGIAGELEGGASADSFTVTGRQQANPGAIAPDSSFTRRTSRANRQTAARGNGGNITINARDGFIVTLLDENSEIIANAFEGNGGNINITAIRLFGTVKRDSPSPELRANRTNDISASSRFASDGIIAIQNLNADPIQGAVALPTDTAAPPLSQGCEPGIDGRGRFTNTERGGIPSNPLGPLESARGWEDIYPIPSAPSAYDTAVEEQGDRPSEPSISQEIAEGITEAEGWQRNQQGQVVLVQTTPTSHPIFNCQS
ncbi:MAG: filamentous hemagglutinin N-terminal domain-containing protein [Cyanobacteria bacterium P01_F01_bin.150]